jgi:hypothetical protein
MHSKFLVEYRKIQLCSANAGWGYQLPNDRECTCSYYTVLGAIPVKWNEEICKLIGIHAKLKCDIFDHYRRFSLAVLQ